MRKFLSGVLAVLLAGCAGNPFLGYDVQPGTSREAVLERMGRPTRVVRLPNGGERLQYSLQRFGQYAWMVDLDGSGRVVQSRQVLNESDFNRIRVGAWTRDEVEREFGPPALVERVGNWPGPILTYRWKDSGNTDMFYFVYLDNQNVVRRAHPGIEFHNGPNRD